ncbi:AMP-binding protein [Nocardia brasiliensis]|uniref:AMP-binding protein n=1 Tax=Nocardia brasiliensis TaxID=37326 RepID=UPI00366E43DF
MTADLSSSVEAAPGSYRRLPPDRIAHYRSQGWWLDGRLEEHIARVAAQAGTKTAVVAPNQRLTYRQLWHAVERLAAELADAAIVPGDRIAVQMNNCAELAVALLGVLRAGAIPVPVMPSLGVRETSHVVATAQAALMIIAPARDVGARRALRRLGEVADRIAAPIAVLGLPEAADRAAPVLTPMTEGRSRAISAPARELDHVAVMLLSSGTTGLPKLIPREHGPFGYMITRAAAASEFDADSVYLAVLPATHGFTLDCPGVLGTLLVGGTVVFGDHRNPAAALAMAAGERVTHTTVVPAVARQWLTEGAGLARCAATMRVIQIGGARPSEVLMRSLEEGSSAFVQQCYGMSEGLLCFTDRSDPDSVRYRTQGRPASPGDELRLVGDNGEIAAGAGELWTRGPYTVAGYFDDAAADRRGFAADGFYRTGDVASIAPDGSVTILGRTGDVISRGGENISPDEIEDALRGHPEIEDVAVVGRPDDTYGELISVFVVTPDWAGPPLAALRDHLRTQGFAEYKLPDDVKYVGEIPKIGIGKVDRKRLRALLVE